jgi:hypothetical protein
MLLETPQPYGLLYYPRIGLPNFSNSSALPRPLSREVWNFKPVIYMFPTFATSRLREIIAAKGGLEMAGKFSLKLPDFHVAFRDLFYMP